MKFLRMKNPDIYITYDALKDRLKDAKRREDDYDALKAASDARPIELWDTDGTYASMPARLIPTNKPYDDAAQLQRWIDVAKNLGGKPPAHINPAYARFLLKPSVTLKSKIKLYFTPADPPVYGVDVDKLKTIIKANQAKFSDWEWDVRTFTDARDTMGLKLVGQNYLQFYFSWMEVDHYKELWQEFKVSELLHAFPADSDDPPAIYDTVDKRLKKSTRDVDGQEVTVTSKKIDSARGNREGSTATIMGESATKVSYV